LFKILMLMLELEREREFVQSFSRDFLNFPSKKVEICFLGPNLDLTSSWPIRGRSSIAPFYPEIFQSQFSWTVADDESWCVFNQLQPCLALDPGSLQFSGSDLQQVIFLLVIIGWENLFSSTLLLF
jgi:hypothetical protein